MAITYPLTLPTEAGIMDASFRAANAVAYDYSPFTFSGQSQAYAGQRFWADIGLPPLDRDDAEAWVAFLISLRGQYGTFLLGDPVGATPRGEGGGSPVVDGADQTGQDLSVSGATVSQSGWLKAGDYIQLGSGSTSSLHKVLADIDTNGSGEAAMSVWPHIKTAPADGATVTLSNTVGLFRLASNETSWTVSAAQQYGITFSAMEAI